MSNSSGSALTRTHGSDRFYSPPAVRKNQKQLQRPLKSDTRVDSAEPDTRTDSDDSSLLRPNSVASSSPPATPNSTNFDRLLASLTPHVPARFLSEVAAFVTWRSQIQILKTASPLARPGMKGRKTPQSNGCPYFFLEDLWESFRECSAYGVAVPLIVNGSDSIKQYYVPYMSAIQLYAEPTKRRVGEDSVAESSKETSSDGSSEGEANKGARGDNLMNIYSQRLSRLTLREGTTMSSSSYETEVCNSPGQLVYEYFEGALPHCRPPFHDKVSTLASEFPNLKKYKSSDLSPSSWFSVAWYPIYRIPVGSTLRSLDASFLTFHSLSTHSRSRNQPQYRASSGRKVQGVDESLDISLPIFALASYKFRGSVLSPNEASELEQVNSLLQAAADWLQSLQVKHPDYQYFVSRSSQWR